MPLNISSGLGAVSAGAQAGIDAGRLKTAQKRTSFNNFAAGVDALGTAMKDQRDKNEDEAELFQYAESIGVDVKSLPKNPKALEHAIGRQLDVLKQTDRQKFEEALINLRGNVDKAAQKQGFENAQALQKSQDSLTSWREQETERRAAALDEKIGGQSAKLAAPYPGFQFPIPDMKTGSLVPRIPGREATRADVRRRAAEAPPGTYMQSALDSAYKSFDKPPAWDETPEGFQEKTDIQTQGRIREAKETQQPAKTDPLGDAKGREIEARIAKLTAETERMKKVQPSADPQREARIKFYAEKMRAAADMLDTEGAAAAEAEWRKELGIGPAGSPAAPPPAPAGHPSGAPADKVQKLEAAGYRWNGTGWVK